MLVAFLQLLGDLFLVGHFAESVHIDVADDARAVDDDDRALGPADLLVEDAVGLRDLSVRPEVAAQRVLGPAERIGPGLERVDAVA